VGFPSGGNEGTLGGYIPGESEKTVKRIEKPRFSNQRRGFYINNGCTALT